MLDLLTAEIKRGYQFHPENQRVMSQHFLHFRS